MMVEHSPGPWRIKVTDSSEDYRSLSITAADGTPVITYDYGHDDCIQIGDANARLIAAAPDLLAACKAMNTADSSAEITHAWKLLWAAIAKAEGRTP